MFLSISDSNFRRSGLTHRRFRMEDIAKMYFSWKSFLKKFRFDFECFVDAFGAFGSGAVELLGSCGKDPGCFSIVFSLDF